MQLRRAALLLGLLLFLGLWAACTLALYRAPQVRLELAWDGQGWRLPDGEQVLGVGNRPVNRYTFLIDNVELHSRSEVFAWLQARKTLYEAAQDETLPLELADGRRLQVPLSRDNWRFLDEPALLHLPVAVLFFLVGWAAYLRPQKGPQALWFYLTCLSMSVVYLTNVASLLAPLSFWPPLYRWVNYLNVSQFVLAPTLLLHFSLLLPRPRAHPLFLAGLYGIGGIIAFGLWVQAHPVWVPLVFMGSLLAIAQGAWSYREPIERQQMKWVGAGFLFGVGPWVLLNGLPMLLWGERLMTDTIPGAFLICIPLFMAVAIHRYRLFELESLLEGTAVYVLTLGVLVLCELAILSALGQSARIGATELLVLALLAGVYGSLRSVLARGVAAVFRRRDVPLPAVLDMLHRSSAGRSPAQILSALQETVAHWFAPSRFETVSVDADRPTGAFWESDPSGSVLLVMAEGQALRCGPLPGGRRYLPATMKVLSELARQARLYYEHAQFYQESLRERQQRLEERESLLGDLHDGVGSALASIRLVTQEPHVGQLAADALFELQNFLYEDDRFEMPLRSWLAEIRAYANRHAGLQFKLVASGELERRLSRSRALGLLRLLREALNNSLRHARATDIELEVEAGDRLELRWQDDGPGLPDDCLQGRGLAGMRARVEKLGGSFQVENRPGCTLLISLPWENP